MGRGCCLGPLAVSPLGVIVRTRATLQGLMTALGLCLGLLLTTRLL